MTSAATPGRMTFEVSRPGIGTRTDDDVTNRIEAPSRSSGRRRADQPDRVADEQPERALPAARRHVEHVAGRRAARVDERCRRARRAPSPPERRVSIPSTVPRSATHGIAGSPSSAAAGSGWSRETSRTRAPSATSASATAATEALARAADDEDLPVETEVHASAATRAGERLDLGSAVERAELEVVDRASRPGRARSARRARARRAGRRCGSCTARSRRRRCPRRACAT